MYNSEEQQYLNTLRELMASGNYREGRNGATYSLFGTQMRFDLRQGFPLLTTKRIFTKGVVAELLWMLKGMTNIKYLTDHGVHIWDEWADENGDLGPVYGSQWRNWMMDQAVGIDQIADVIEGIKKDPYGRRHMVIAWNPNDIADMKLPPCHCLFQFHVANNMLSCHLYQRSADWFLGAPFNIASYALLTHLVARECDLQVGSFVHSFGDYHLYATHLNAAKEQLTRTTQAFCEVNIAAGKGIFDLEPDDISFIGYEHGGAIKAPVSV